MGLLWVRVAWEEGFMEEMGFSSLRISSIWIIEASGKDISNG